MATTQTGLIEVNPYNQIKDVTAFVREMGESIAKSGLFGCENVEQGKVLALTCYAKGVDPMSLSDTFHIIGGKLSKRADAMLRDLVRAGGRYKVLCRTSNKAEIEIEHGGQTQRFPFTIDEAMAEPFSKTKKGDVQPNYATPRKRMQMLWARVVSDGVRTICPEAACGTYTPEEVSDFTNGQTVDEPLAALSKAEVEEVVEVVAEPTKINQEVAKSEPKPEDNGYCTTEQSIRIRELFDQLQVPAEKREAALAKRGAATIRNLTHEAAATFIASLEAMATKLTTSMVGESRANPAAINQDNCDPCTEIQVNTARELIKDLAQQIGPQIAQQIKSRLQACGLEKIADLTVSECACLLNALSLKNLEVWASQALLGHKPRSVNEDVPF